MVVWPFKIRDEFIETAEWFTDVIRTKNKEQRFAQRQAPRTTYNYSHYLTIQEYNAAQAIIKQNETFLVPDWSLAISYGFLASGSPGSIPYGEAFHQLDIGDYILVWESSAKYEAVLILDTDSADTFSGNISQTYSNAKLVPLHTANCPTGLRATRQAGNIINAEIEFEITDTRDIGYSAYDQYRGEDVIDDCPVIAGTTFNEPISYPTDSFDNDISNQVYMTQRNFYDFNKQMRWHVFNRADLYSLRRFLHSRRGRWKPFWMSSFSRDFELAAPIVSNETFITVYAPRDLTDLGVTSFDIEIDGQHYRQVTSYADGIVGGRVILQLNLSAQVGLNLGTRARVSYLHFMRFNVDRVELQHRARAGVSVAIPTIELNEL